MKNGEKPLASPVVILREEFDDWAILFNPDTGRGFGLSPTGVHLWKHLDGEHTINDLLEEIRRHAEGVPEEASDHIGAFIDALVREGLAGFDSARFGALIAASGPEKCSSLPLRKVGEAKPFRYEPPKLVDFREGRAAYGSCTNGSHNSGLCGTGNLAGCCTTGNSPGTYCCGGCGQDGCGTCGNCPTYTQNCYPTGCNAQESCACFGGCCDSATCGGSCSTGRGCGGGCSA